MALTAMTCQDCIPQLSDSKFSRWTSDNRANLILSFLIEFLLLPKEKMVLYRNSIELYEFSPRITCRRHVFWQASFLTFCYVRHRRHANSVPLVAQNVGPGWADRRHALSLRKTWARNTWLRCLRKTWYSVTSPAPSLSKTYDFVETKYAKNVESWK